MISTLESSYKEFFEYLDYGKVFIDYSFVWREFTVFCTDGVSGIQLEYCPWSGKKFPESVRDEWFDILRSMGFEDPLDQDIPEEFNSEKWWIDRNL